MRIKWRWSLVFVELYFTCENSRLKRDDYKFSISNSQLTCKKIASNFKLFYVYFVVRLWGKDMFQIMLCFFHIFFFFSTTFSRLFFLVYWWFRLYTKLQNVQFSLSLNLSFIFTIFCSFSTQQRLEGWNEKN